MNGKDDGLPSESVSLRDYFDRILEEHERMHAELAKGIVTARDAQDKRLDAMNEFRAALQDTASRTVTREVFDANIKERELRFSSLTDRIVALEKSQVSEERVDSLRDDNRRQRNGFFIAVAVLGIGVLINLLVNVLQNAPR